MANPAPTSTRAGEFFIKVRGFSKSLSISLANQIISSASNFGILLYLLRELEKLEFGTYSLGFATILLISGCTVSLFSVPLAINLPRLPVDQRKAYTLNQLVISGAIGGLIVLIGLAASWTLEAYLPATEIYLAVALSSAFYGLRDLLSRLAFSERKESVVLTSTTISSVTIFLGFFLTNILNQRLTDETSLLIYAASQFTGLLTTYLLLKLPKISSITTAGLKDSFIRSWGGGKWNLMTNITYNLRTQAHNFISAPILGFVALAEINAARTFVTPAILLIPPLSQIVTPRLAQLRTTNPSRLLRISTLTTLTLLAICLIYAATLLPLLPWALPIITDGKYPDIDNLIFLWCANTILLSVRNGLSITLEVTENFKEIFKCNLISAVFAIIASTTLSLHLGGEGALIALISTELLLCILLTATLKRQSPRLKLGI
ncbi:lipopolysaccharide biosynthesis protein [Metapseudomonas resinovorans]|uniref:lipopolysaccharide biosynthesis protein n=1 Tax=Metapseudomonas resinovorans TaxID=53412 RepID=UPI00131E47D7|nr:hypothetical protein [Pseudomonas resinovorans]